MASSRTIKVEILGDVRNLQRSFGVAAASARGFESRLGTLGSRLGGLAKTSAIVAGVAGIGGLALAVKAGIGEFAAAAKASAQTAAVLKSTGGAAHVTAQQVDALATSLMNKSGIDDEAIKSGENLLLTFTNIRNEAGKGNDIFTQATKVITDMSVALGEDMGSAAIQVGKALNDPIKGITALQRVGVSFTQGQRDQIKALVDSGHAMEAQKVIIRELNREFQGSAAAMGKTLPGQINILKQNLRNLAGDLVGTFAPAFGRAVQAVSGFLQRLNAAQGFRAKLNVIWEGAENAARAAFDLLKRALEAINWGALWQGIRTNVQGIADRFNEGLKSVNWNEFGHTLGQAIVTSIKFADDLSRKMTEEITKAMRSVDWKRALLGLAQGIKGDRSIPEAVKDLWLKAFRFSPAGAANAMGIKAVKAISGALAGGARQTQTEFMNALSPALERAVGAAISAAAEVAARESESIGSSMASGAARGALNAWYAVANAITQVVRTAIGYAYTHAGSTVDQATAEKLGKPFIDGIVRGILAGLPQAQGAAAQAAQKVVAEATAGKLLAEVQRAGRTIGLEHAKAIAAGMFQGQPGIVAQFRQHVQEWISAARQKVVDSRAAFRDAFQSLASDALAAFDEQVAKWVPPSQKILDQMQIEDSIRSAQQSVDDAQSALDGAAAALAAAVPSEGESASDFASRLADLTKNVTDAERQLGDAKRAQVENNLQLEAQQEQRAHDARMATDRDNFAKRLAQIQNGVLTERLTYQQAQQQLIALFARYHVPMFQAGQRLAEQFASGLTKGIAAVVAAARKLADALEQVSGAPASSGGGTSAAARSARAGLRNIPEFFASGGIVRRPTLGVVGEAGPEAVVPLSRIGQGQLAGGGGLTLQITFEGGTFIGGNADKVAEELTRPLVKKLAAYSRANGRTEFV